jgi:hypothetical protein
MLCTTADSTIGSRHRRLATPASLKPQNGLDNPLQMEKRYCWPAHVRDEVQHCILRTEVQVPDQHLPRPFRCELVGVILCHIVQATEGVRGCVFCVTTKYAKATYPGLGTGCPCRRTSFSFFLYCKRFSQRVDRMRIFPDLCSSMDSF